MPKLDYSIPDFTFQVGAFDATDYLDAIALSCPMHEPTQPLIWTGNFRVSLNRLAQQRGLTDADFSPLDSPTIWRPGQQPVTLAIKGQDLPILRIERYAYNPQTRTGEGSLTQILGLVAGDRPAVDPEITLGKLKRDNEFLYSSFDGKRSITVYANPALVNDAADLLVREGFRGTPINPNPARLGLTGSVQASLITRDPITDAQKLCATSWRWLTVSNAEQIQTVSGNPSDHPLIFNRSLDLVELEPDIGNINFAASEIIVTGSRQKVDLDKILAAIEEANAERPKSNATEEMQPYGTVYPDSTSTTPTLADKKTVVYQYADDLSLGTISSFGLTGEIISDMMSIGSGNTLASGVPVPSDRNQPVQTITVRQQPMGRLFPDEGANSSLAIAEVSIESVVRRSIYAPAGVLIPDRGTDTSLILKSKEILQNDYIERQVDKTPSSIANSPLTGQPTLYEPTPIRETNPELAQIPLATEVIRGEASVEPLGWTPIRSSAIAIEFGFLPSEGHAEDLATHIAKREQRRRDAVQITMPIPDEWLAAGCPLLSRCQIGDDIYQMDGLIFAMADGQAKFSFAGGLVSRSGAALFSTLVDLPSQFAVEIDKSVIAPNVDELGVAFQIETSFEPVALFDWVAEVEVGLFRVLQSSEVIVPVYVDALVDLQEPLIVNIDSILDIDTDPQNPFIIELEAGVDAIADTQTPDVVVTEFVADAVADLDTLYLVTVDGAPIVTVDGSFIQV